MQSKIQIEKNQNLKNNFEYFISKYLLPLLGFSEKIIKEHFNKQEDQNGLPTSSVSQQKITQTNEMLYFHNRGVFDENYYCTFKINSKLDDENMNLAILVINSFFDVFLAVDSEKVKSKKLNSNLFNYIIEKGICMWMINTKTEIIVQVEKLFMALENWSNKTYEGHHVCFGFIINGSDNRGKLKKIKDKSREVSGDFIDFIRDEYSAVVTDGISSVIELDSNCEFKNYISVTDNNEIKSCKLNYSSPYRFSQIISNYVTGDKVGVFLLINGDIIIAKSGKIHFIKRNSKWLNFNFFSFDNAVADLSLNQELLMEIYASVLDVSLSHTGGIIAVVDENNDEWVSALENKKDKLISELDLFKKDSYIDDDDDELEDELYSLYQNEMSKQEFKNEYDKEKFESDLKKRLNKRKYIIKMLLSNGENKTKINSFSNIYRKLRAELIGLDGACIINKQGEIKSFGAIVKSAAGSSGGGRGAAAKRLSTYGGFAIKISTDGYIEVYLNKNKIYSIK